MSDGAQIFALQQEREKALGNILCLFGPETLPPHEGINGSPIGAAKLLECYLCRGRIILRGQHQAPVGGRKRRRALVKTSAHQRGRVVLSGSHITSKLR